MADVRRSRPGGRNPGEHGRGEPTRAAAPLPGVEVIFGQGAAQPRLGSRAEDDPGPAGELRRVLDLALATFLLKILDPRFLVCDRPGRASPRKSKKAGDFPARKIGEPSVTSVTWRIELHFLEPLSLAFHPGC